MAVSRRQKPHARRCSELAPELTRRREAIITALFNHTPPEFHRAITDLRKLIDLMLEAHEAAAYLVGFESGRLAEQTHLGRSGYTRYTYRQSAVTGATHGPRLTMGEGETR